MSRESRENDVSPLATARGPPAELEHSLKNWPSCNQATLKGSFRSGLQPLNIIQVEVMKLNKSVESFKIDWRKGTIWH